MGEGKEGQGSEGVQQYPLCELASRGVPGSSLHLLRMMADSDQIELGFVKFFLNLK
jgi:hypothetical protein